MEVTRCRICHSSKLMRFLDLGSHPPADRFITLARAGEPEPKFPLRVVVCEECGLVQLDHVVPGDILYCNDYPYESSTTRTGRNHWNEFAETVTTAMGLGPDDLVVDVGSNVGVLLGMFAQRGARVLGVDPASNIAEIACKLGIETVCAFFNAETAANLAKQYGRATVISGTNVFAHVDDLHNFMDGVKALLADDGLFVIEVPYLVNLIERLEYDTIYHEHLSYISLTPLVGLFAHHDMEIADVQSRDIHGGSIRIWVQRKGLGRLKPSDAVEQLLALEEYKAVHKPERLRKFAEDVAENRRNMRWLLDDLKRSGKRVVAVSAPAKGMTLLNYCNIGRDDLEYVTEKSKLKIGRITPGGHIPVVADDQLLADPPDYALLLAWNFADEIIANLKGFSDAGGKFIIPLPTIQIVE